MNKKTVEKHLLTSAHSRENGIVFESVECPFMQVDSFVNDNGEIESVIVPKEIGKLHEIAEFEKDDDSSRSSFKIFLIAVVLFDIIVLTTLIASGQVFGVIWGWFYFCFSCSPKILKQINNFYYLDHSTKKFVANPILKFHAAEHMAYNFYNKHKRVPTLEELKKSSRFTEYCGRYHELSELAVSILFAIFLMFVLPNTNLLANILILFIFLFVCNKLIKNGSFKYLEIFVTKKPTELELRCALKGIETFDRMEKSFRKNKCIGQIIQQMDNPESVTEYITTALDYLVGSFFEEEEDDC